MQVSPSTVTMPVFSSFWVAPVGHTAKQAGVSQCWHCIGRKLSVQLGNSPAAVSKESPPTVITLLYARSAGRLFATLHATSHAWHPKHRLRSIAIP